MLAVDDELAEWVRNCRETFFLTPDDTVAEALTTVNDWAVNSGYDPAAVNTFLQVADFWLVGHALATKSVLVTHEIAADTVRKIKIPNACIGLGISCVSPFEMLRIERARFVLETPGANL